jgi:hypothetical protein
MESDMTAEEVHSVLVKENILPLKIETHEDAVKAASAEVIEALTIGVAQEAGEDEKDEHLKTVPKLIKHNLDGLLVDIVIKRCDKDCEKARHLQ